MCALGPTSYELDRDVKRLAEGAVRGRKATWNTYTGHGRGFTTDRRAVDFWGPGGRGAPISPRTGSRILKELFNKDGGPQILYYIWRGKIWNPGQGETAYSDPQDQHFDHLHVSYK